MKHVQWLGWVVVGSALLSGCAGTRGDYDVPVVEGGSSNNNSSVNGGSFSPPIQVSAPRRPTATVDIPESGTHVVRKGDTLYNIASRYGLTPRELADMNQLIDPNHINLGQTLKVNRRTGSARADSFGNSSRTSESRSWDAASDGNGVEVRPLSDAPIASGELGGADSAGGVVVRPSTAPKVPYSDEAWKSAQKEKELARQKAGEVVSKQPYSDEAWRKSQEQKAKNPLTGGDSFASPDGAAEETTDFLWPTAGKVVHGFGTVNKGIDIAGKLGQPIVAAESGKVVYVGSGLRGYGKLIILKHTKQFLTAYAHNRENFVKEGQEVNRGQKIAEMGNTDSDQVKLHFEVRKLGKPVDPIKYLPER